MARRSERQSAPAEVWIVEDNDLLRDSIAALVNDQDGLRCGVAVSSCEEALEALEDQPVPDIVLMDIGLPGMSGIEGVTRIRSLSPSSRMIMLTVHEERETVFEAICAGASGYLLKPSSAERIVDAIHDVIDGAAPINAYIARKVLDMFGRVAPPRADYGLTRRETEVLEAMVDGLTMQQIADRMFVSYHTIDTHIRNIYEKLHVHSRTGAVAKALKERLI